MKRKDLIKLGIPEGPMLKIAADAAVDARRSGMRRKEIKQWVRAILRDPDKYKEDRFFHALASAVAENPAPDAPVRVAAVARAEPFIQRPELAPMRRWGGDMDEEAIHQIEDACRLPISVRAALMPDAHVGYGLPIGGVLAVREAVIPYAVGVDIACRMKMTVLDFPVSAIKGRSDQLKNAIMSETRFGVGASFNPPRDHDVMDEDWLFSPVTSEMKDKAWRQLGTSGSGNHFVEFGVLTVEREGLGLEPGTYLALLSHSGSRGVGNRVATHYSRIAMQMRPDMPRELRRLAWLDLQSAEGAEYWHAMQLMGRYAAANHALIHRHIARNLKAEVLLDIENHHNFAWKEEHDGQEVVVHRKGATPAGAGAIGIIPGSMAAPGFIVRGRGNAESLNSAAHGAGRAMSRGAAKRSITWSAVRKILKDREIDVMSAGVDEAPAAYKNIEAVMAAQADLVEVLARFDPKIVKMAPAGERPED